MKTDKERIDWMENMMKSDTNYCEIFFAGLRNFKDGHANSYQIESNPEKFATSQGQTLREAIDKAINLTL